MTKLIEPSAIDGYVRAPSSKSAAQRAIMAALLSRGTSVLRGITLCADTASALQAAHVLGAQAEVQGVDCRIVSHFAEKNVPAHGISCGESGLLARMAAPIASLLNCSVTLTGRGSLAARPITMIEDALRQLGVQTLSTRGRLPLRIRGPLQCGRATIDGSSGSQILTGLLMALPLVRGTSNLRVQNLQSRPYIDLTIDLIQRFGIDIRRRDYEEFYIQGGQQYQSCTFDIEGDWSAASCLLAAGCIAGKVSVGGLNVRSLQADNAIVPAIRQAGGSVFAETINGTQAITSVKSRLRSFEFNAANCPDLFPALAALAACAQGTSRISGVERLTHKESSRALTLQSEFGKLGIDIIIKDSDMYVTGGVIGGGCVSAHNDHRLAMSLAAAALCATAPVTIDGSECVSKSYPRFWHDLARLQGKE